MRQLYEKEHLIMRLFDAFAKPRKDEQLEIYFQWAENVGTSRLEKTVNWAVAREERFPTISRLNGIVKSQKKFVSEQYRDECYFCGSTGVVPVLHEPDIVSDVYHIRMMACKCSLGLTAGVPPYFKKFPTLQFSVVKNFSGNYPQYVDSLKRDKNEALRGDDTYIEK
tara:strand:+ start:238 stop:738 length:501 start_codon:yes stop_codon:yes gene_type:complete